MEFGSIFQEIVKCAVLRASVCCGDMFAEALGYGESCFSGVADHEACVYSYVDECSSGGDGSVPIVWV